MKIHEQFPNILKMSLGIAAVNGAVNRLEPEQLILEKVDYTFGAEGVYFDDVEVLENWLGSLTPEQLSEFEDGEATEIDALMLQSPVSPHNGRHVANLFHDFWENL